MLRRMWENLARVWKKLEVSNIAGRNKMVEPFGKTFWQFIQMFESYNFTQQILGRYQEKWAHMSSCSQMFMASSFMLATNENNWKVHQLMKNQRTSYICMIECNSVIESNKVLIDTTTWLDLRNIIRSERSQTQKTTYCMISFIAKEQTKE